MTNELVELISIQYRRKLIESRELNRKIVEISKELTNVNISHKRFLDLTNWMENLKKEKEEIELIAEGISIAREVVMNYVFKKKGVI